MMMAIDDAERGSGIWAGIVTYNPDMERLRENVGAILPQVDRLLIFDNGSANVDEVERAFGDIARLTKGGENLGMAKALNVLASAALEGGASDIVFLDQDSVAAADLVAAEATYRAGGVGLVCCLVVDRNVEKAQVDPTVVLQVKRAVTSGSMVNLAAWDKVGRYDETLFVDWVDNEFCDNLRLHGFELLRTHATSILHEMGSQERAWSAPGRDYTGSMRASRGYYRQNYPPWRWRDRARSQIITIRRYRGTPVMLEEVRLFLRGIGRILLLEKNKAACIRAVLDGVRDAGRVRPPRGQGCAGGVR